MSRVQRLAGLTQQGSLYVLLFLLPFSKAAVEVAFGGLLLGWLTERLVAATRWNTIWQSARLRSVAIGLAVYVGVCALSIVGSDQWPLSLRALFSKWLEYLLLLVIAADLGSRPGVVQRSIVVIVISSALVALEAVSQEVFDKGIIRGYPIHGMLTFDRMTGPYENPADLATYLMVVIPIVFVVAITRRRWRRWCAWVVLVALIGCFARTEATGAWAAFVIGWLALLKRNTVLRHVGLAVLAVTVIAGGFLLYQQGRLATALSSRDIGTVDRRVMWQAAIGMIRDRPILGHGLNTFMANYLAYWVGGERMPRYAHNCYLQVAAETGLIGLAAFLWLLWSLFSVVRAALRPPLSHDGLLLLGAFAGLLAFVVHAAVDTNFYALRQAALFWVLAGLAVGLSEQIRASPSA